AGEPAQRILRRVALPGLRQLRRDLPLRVRELPRFELHLTERAPPLVRGRRLHLPFERAQTFERALRARGRLPGILPSQIARRVAHLFGDVAHPLAGVAAGATLIRLTLLLAARLPLLALLAALPLLTVFRLL